MFGVTSQDETLRSNIAKRSQSNWKRALMKDAAKGLVLLVRGMSLSTALISETGVSHSFISAVRLEFSARRD